MQNLERLTLAEMEEFVKSNRGVKMDAAERGGSYELIEAVLRAQGYRRLKKSAKGTLRGFLAKVTTLSRAQIPRLIAGWMQTRWVEKKPAQRPSFPRRYGREDVALLAAVDAAHEDLSGPAVRHILKREFHVYGHAAYRKIRVRVEHTQARHVSIAERRITMASPVCITSTRWTP